MIRRSGFGARITSKPMPSTCKTGQRAFARLPANRTLLRTSQNRRQRSEADVLSITARNACLRASAISVGFVGFDSPGVDIDSLRVDIAAAADLPRRRGNTRFRAAHILLSHAGHSQEWRDECDGKNVFDRHDFSPPFTRKHHRQVTTRVASIFIKAA